jgi:hypothetical protein
MKIGVIVDRMTVTRWQAEALRGIAPSRQFIIYNCGNSRPGRRRSSHALYYLLNLVTIRNFWTRRIHVPADLPVLATRNFDALHRGAWQCLPPDLLDEIRRDRPAAIVKFGMGLLDIPPDDSFGIPILSYHHGDPAHFRGRPAGFYETLGGTPVMGQVVQRLSNALDSGDVLASAETKVFAHSYRATLMEAYRHSPLILRRALENAIGGQAWRPGQWGPSYRLPGNGLVLRFLIGRVAAFGSRLFYGLFKEKKWRVATAPVDDDPSLDSLTDDIAVAATWRTVPTPTGHRFLADPFFHPDRGLLVEALNRRSSRGEILQVSDSLVLRLSQRGGHFSYPATVEDDGKWYVVPEISDWSRPQLFPLEGGGFSHPLELRIAGRPRLLDPTPFRHDGVVYLFGNDAGEGASVLRLWVARSIRDEFVEHPASPVRISPNGARMAGTPARIAGQLVRFGQDFRRGYGDGVTAFAITRIDERDYREEPIGELRFGHCRGPHTLNFGKGEVAFDYYVERFSVLAGWRRWRDRRAARGTT